ncbi:MAG: hypothetical protein ACP5U2_13755 [Bryobacteraceae bacterium]
MAPSELIGFLMTAIQAVVFYAIMAIVIWKVIRIENEIRQLKSVLEQVRFLLERKP